MDSLGSKNKRKNKKYRTWKKWNSLKKKQKEAEAQSYYEEKQRIENEGISPHWDKDSGHNCSQTYQCMHTHLLTYEDTCVQTHA